MQLTAGGCQAFTSEQPLLPMMPPATMAVTDAGYFVSLCLILSMNYKSARNMKVKFQLSGEIKPVCINCSTYFSYIFLLSICFWVLKAG
jgi:hypothetical protein